MDIETFFPYRLAISAETFSRNLSDVYGHAFGLSREEWRLLFLLSDAVSVTSLELSARSTLDKVQVSRAAKRLEEKGYITRSIVESDRRLRNYQISPKGKALFTEALPKVQARAGEILAAFSREELTDLVDKLETLQRAAQARLERD
jgi:DNA-binding MarR family transcriptional regulator